MLPYQIYQALTDQRVRDLMAEARRHELTTAARRASRGRNEPSGRLRDMAAQMLAILHVRRSARALHVRRSARALHVRRGAGAGSTMISASGAGPMGCRA